MIAVGSSYFGGCPPKISFMKTIMPLRIAEVSRPMLVLSVGMPLLLHTVRAGRMKTRNIRRACCWSESFVVFTSPLGF